MKNNELAIAYMKKALKEIKEANILLDEIYERMLDKLAMANTKKAA